MNIDLSHYIEQARKSGIIDEHIRQGLLQSGWQDNDINEAMTNAPVAIIPPSKSKAMMSRTLATIFSVLGIAVIGYFVGAYYMSSYQNFPLWPFDLNILAPTFTPRPSPAVKDPTADWKTYRNEEYGFEVKYPRNLEVQENKDDSGQDEWRVGDTGRREVDGWLVFDFYILAANKQDLNTFIKNYYSDPAYILKQETLYFGIYVEFDGLPGYAYFQLFPEQDKFLKFEAGHEYLQSQVFSQILSTFKFINKTDNPILPSNFNWPKLDRATLGMGALSYELIVDSTKWGSLDLEGNEWGISCKRDSVECNKYNDWRPLTDYKAIESNGWKGWGSGDVIYKNYKLKPIVADGAGSTVQGFVKINENKITVYVYLVYSGQDRTDYKVFLSREYDLDTLLPR